MNSEHEELLAHINATGDFDDEIDGKFKAAIEQFKATQTW